MASPHREIFSAGSQLRGPQSQLGGPQSQLGGDGEKRKKNGAFIVCGGTIGHRPLRGRCPKTEKLYVVFCPIVVHIPNFIQIGQKM